MNYYRILFCVILTLLLSKASAQVKFQRSWFYTSIDTVTSQNVSQQPFKLLNKAYQSPPFHNQGVYWFKLDIENEHPDKDLIINIKNPHLDSVFLFQYINGKILVTDTGGNSLKHRDSTFMRYVRFKIKGGTSTVWLKTQLKKEILFPVTVNTVVDFYKAESISFLKLGVYYGIAVIVLIVNIFLYFSFKEPKFLYYSVLVFMIALLYAYADGLYALASRNPIWLNYASLPIMLGATIATVAFSIKFLELENRYTYLFWVNTVLLVLMALCFLAYVVFDWTVASVLGNMMLPLLLMLYWLIALSRFKQHSEAKFFVFASALSLVFTLNFFIFRYIGLDFLNLMPRDLKIGNILQMFILSTGILYRIKTLHKENTYYREEIQQYLKNQPADRQEEKEVSPLHVFIQLQEQFGLSEREIDVLKLLAEGLSNQQIGETLYLSANTVKFHIRNIYLKMEINNRTQALNIIHKGIH